jgi:tRNA-splicing ligase RtcB
VKIINGIPVWGDPVDPGALEQIVRCSARAARVAMMADHHLGYAVPIGGVVAYEDAVSPSGVGYDIGCGNKAVRLDVVASAIRPDIGKIMDEIWRSLSFGIGRKNNEQVDDPLFDHEAWTIRGVAPLKQMAREQLGTIGSGNHYVDIFADELDRVWIGVHFGSRGFGHKIATHFLREGGGKDGMHVEPLVLPVSSIIGTDYLAAMRLAGVYAYAGRDWVCERVGRIIGAKIVEEVHNHHNYAWREQHDGIWLWVVRKGATPAFPGQRGFVGATMGETAVILEGVDGPEAKEALYSTVHGAGRVMSRGQAKRTITEDAMRSEVAHVELRGGGVDEAPAAYKRLNAVLAHHAASVRIVHRLNPLGVAMAGPREHDPYKD